MWGQGDTFRAVGFCLTHLGSEWGLKSEIRDLEELESRVSCLRL